MTCNFSTMESSEIPELEDCSGEIKFKSCATKEKAVENQVFTGGSADDKLSAETKQLFKRTLGKSFNSEKKMNPSEHSKVRHESISNGNIILNRNSPQWITDDLLSQISSDPEISAWLQRPDKASILDRMKTNPRELVASMDADDKDVIQKISGILADHFEKLSISESEGGQEMKPEPFNKPLIEEVMSPEEREMENQVKGLLANEKIRNALQDAEVQRTIEALRTDPAMAHRMLHQASGDVKEKINILIENGILGIQY